MMKVDALFEGINVMSIWKHPPVDYITFMWYVVKRFYGAAP